MTYREGESQSAHQESKIEDQCFNFFNVQVLEKSAISLLKLLIWQLFLPFEKELVRAEWKGEAVGGH